MSKVFPDKHLAAMSVDTSAEIFSVVTLWRLSARFGVAGHLQQPAVLLAHSLHSTLPV